MPKPLNTHPTTRRVLDLARRLHELRQEVTSLSAGRDVWVPQHQTERIDAHMARAENDLTALAGQLNGTSPVTN